MNDTFALCDELEAVSADLDGTPPTERNLGQIRDLTARGFRAIASNIRSAYESAKASQVPPPAAPSEQPGNSDPAQLAGSEAPTPAAAVEGSTD